MSFNFACTKIILHILCTSLTVPIEPGPCGSAEGGRHDSHPPPPPEREEQAAGGQELGARREGTWPRGSCPTPTSSGLMPDACQCQDHLPLPGPQPQPSSPAGSRPACSGGGKGSGQRRDPQEGPASTGQLEEELVSAERSFVLWFDISLDSMLRFSFCCFGVFYFIFPGGGEEEECLRSSVATTLLFSLLQM